MTLDVKSIDELTATSGLQGTDNFIIEDGTASAKKVTTDEIKTYVKTGLTTTDVAESSNKNYVTDAEKVVIGNTSGTNTGDQVGDGVTITGTGTALDPFVATASGTGDVIGPNSSTANHIPQFSDTTGKVLKDGLGVVTTLGSPGADTNIPTEAAVRAAISSAGGGDVSGPASSTDGEVPLFNGTTGKLLKNSSKTVVTTLGSDNTTIPTSKAVKDVTDLLVAKSLYDANTVLAATTDNTPAALTVGEQTFVGRKTGGNIAALTATEARTILNVADGATANTKATGAEIDTGTDDVKYVTSKAMEDSAYIKATGIPYASSAEINTGTETAKSVNPDALAGSYAGTKGFTVIAVSPTTDLTVADGKAYVVIPECMNGMNLVRANAVVNTAGTTNATTIDIYNVTDNNDMLSTAISIASGNKVGTAGTVNTSYDDVATNDVLRIDVTTVSTTKPKGLIVVLEFRLP